MLTKSSLVTMIETADQEKLARIVGRACVAIFRRQTEDEKVINATSENNGIGFTHADARKGSITAKYFIKHGTLLEWQIDQWLKKDSRGTPRIVKYWKQLAEEATKKAA